MPAINTETQLCAVIGNPIEHSLSPCMHNAAYAAAALNFVYLAFRVEDVGACLSGMRALDNFRGLSVTIPHKLAVMAHLDEIDELARHVGSVNTITHEDGKLMGTTTDGPGTLRAFDEAGVSLDGSRILFTGTGGAVRAVAFAIASMTKAAHITILGRTPAHVSTLVVDLRMGSSTSVSGGLLAETVAELVPRHDVIIQGTPVGMHPNPGGTCIPKDTLLRKHVVFDMVYRPFKTQLVLDAEAVGCKIVPGIEMLIHQAALQFERWTGVAAPVNAMRKAALSALGA